jgi:23S rRNA (cytidine1920-2'-O)/16S rRNA (cytidine1409-2'-O)-methyltransferase
VARKKERLDRLMVERGLAPSRSKAQALIMAGEVRVDGEVSLKAGSQFALDVEIAVETPLPYVSRGGFKLAEALDAFPIGVKGKICADVGASTGGYTDVLLQRGAALVYAIDAGYGQLAWKMRQDERVVVMERTNARYLESLPQLVELVVMDVSFISITLILPAIKGWIEPGGDVVTLIKPQFEAGRAQVGKGGIVKDQAVHRQVLENILSWCRENGYAPAGLIMSPIEGSEGNVEFLAWLRSGEQAGKQLDELIDPLF